MSVLLSELNVCVVVPVIVILRTFLILASPPTATRASLIRSNARASDLKFALVFSTKPPRPIKNTETQRTEDNKSFHFFASEKFSELSQMMTVSSIS